MFTKKAVLRKKLLEKRLQLSTIERDKKDTQICIHLADIIKSNQIETVFSYVSFRNEPNLLPLINQLAPTYSIGLPVIGTKRIMEYYRWQTSERLYLNKYGIGQPNIEGMSPIIPDKSTLLIAPAVAADKDGVRLGYGGGYMDRYLSRFPHMKSVVAIYDEFLLSTLPRDDHDHRFTFVVTEKEITPVPLDRTVPGTD